MSIAKICAANDCSLKYHAKGLCSRHYYRLARLGNINAPFTTDPRPAIIEGDIAKIPLGINARHGYAIVDKELAGLDKYKWTDKSGYAFTKINKKNISMHRVIMGASAGQLIDHINRNPRDNRRCNLRLTTRTNNAGNMFRFNQNTSGFKGICYNKRNRNWIAQIKINYNYQWLGAYSTKEEAAIAYDIAAVQVFGDHALTNIL